MIKVDSDYPRYQSMVALRQILDAGTNYCESDLLIREALIIRDHTFEVEVSKWIYSAVEKSCQAAVIQKAAAFPGEINDMGHLHILVDSHRFPNMRALSNRPYYELKNLLSDCEGILFHTQEYIIGNKPPLELIPSLCNVYYDRMSDQISVLPHPDNSNPNLRKSIPTDRFGELILNKPHVIEGSQLYFTFASDGRLRFLMEKTLSFKDWEQIFLESQKLANLPNQAF